MIRVSLLDNHPVICDAIKALLANSDDIEIVSSANSFE